MTKLYIKNMVCPRCVKVVREELIKQNLTPLNITLGEAEIAEPQERINFSALQKVLENEGFELLEDSKSKLVEQIKIEIINLISNFTERSLETIRLSDYFTERLGKDYTYLSSLFSKVEGITIEKFFILQKIEKAKELLIYGEMNLSEIAYSLGYSSVQHLSRQFKQVTGLTASQFLSGTEKVRKSLDKVKS
jgi:AraC family transcriptional regulator